MQLLRAGGGYLVDVGCCDTARIDMASSDDIWEFSDSLEQLVEQLRSTDAFAKLQMACGFNYNPHGVLADKEMRNFFKPGEMVCFDPMHTWLAQGIATTEAYNFVCRCKETGLKAENFKEYFAADWRLPLRLKITRTSLKSLFDEQRWKSHANAGGLKAFASETWTTVKILNHFA